MPEHTTSGVGVVGRWQNGAGIASRIGRDKAIVRKTASEVEEHHSLPPMCRRRSDVPGAVAPPRSLLKMRIIGSASTMAAKGSEEEDKAVRARVCRDWAGRAPERRRLTARQNSAWKPLSLPPDLRFLVTARGTRGAGTRGATGTLHTSTYSCLTTRARHQARLEFVFVANHKSRPQTPMF